MVFLRCLMGLAIWLMMDAMDSIPYRVNVAMISGILSSLVRIKHSIGPGVQHTQAESVEWSKIFLNFSLLCVKMKLNEIVVVSFL